MLSQLALLKNQMNGEQKEVCQIGVTGLNLVHSQVCAGLLCSVSMKRNKKLYQLEINFPRF
jgi:hypothetical protein